MKKSAAVAEAEAEAETTPAVLKQGAAMSHAETGASAGITVIAADKAAAAYPAAAIPATVMTVTVKAARFSVKAAKNTIAKAANAIIVSASTAPTANRWQQIQQ